MDKKTIAIALGSFALGGLLYTFLFSSADNKPKEETTATATTTEQLADKKEEVSKKKTIYSVSLDKEKGVIISKNGTETGVIPHSASGASDSKFSIVAPTDKTGVYAFAVVENADKSVNFGLISSERIAYKEISTKNNIKNVQPGIMFSPNKKFAVFQYINDGGKCKKDLLLAVINIETGEIMNPEISHDYISGTGVWQVDTGELSLYQ